MYPRDSPDLGHIGQTRRAANDYRTPLFAILPGEIYGDLTGDGQPEAVLEIRCADSPDGSMPVQGSQLLVVTMRPDHSLVGLDYVGVMSAEYLDFAVDNGALRLRLRYDHSTWSSFGSGSDDTAFTQVYRWDGAAFVRTGGRESNLNYRGQKDAYGSKVKLVSILREGAVVCPAATISFGFGEATAGEYTYSQGGKAGGDPGPVDLDGDGNDEYIAIVGCTGPGYDATSVYVFGQGDTMFVPLDVPLANDGRYDVQNVTLTGDTLTITLTVRATGATEIHTLHRSDTRLHPRPRHPLPVTGAASSGRPDADRGRGSPPHKATQSRRRAPVEAGEVADSASIPVSFYDGARHQRSCRELGPKNDREWPSSRQLC